MRKMRICMLHHYYLPMFSGAAIQSHVQARIMRGWGHKVWVLTPHYPGLLHAEVMNGVPVIRAHILGRTRKERFLSFMLSAARELVRRREDYDLLHLFSFGPFDVIPVLAARVLGKRVLYQMTLLGPDPDHVTEGRSSALTRMGLRMVDGLAGLSTPMCKAFLANGFCNLPFRILPYGIDTDLFRPALPAEKSILRKTLGLVQDGKYLCFVGSVVERKGVDVLVSAFKNVVDQHAEARLLMVGPDTFVRPGFESEPYQRCQAFTDSLKQQIQTLGLADRVIFTGYTDRVLDYLRASDVFVFPSRREGFGAAIIEAMATALPCIVADIGGISADIITHGVDGYIIKEYSPGGYAKPILELLANPAQAGRIGQAARRTIEQRFRLEDVVEQYIFFYQKLLGTSTLDGG